MIYGINLGIHSPITPPLPMFHIPRSTNVRSFTIACTPAYATPTPSMPPCPLTTTNAHLTRLQICGGVLFLAFGAHSLYVGP